MIRPIVACGRALDRGLGVAVAVTELPAELTITAGGAFWSPFGPTVHVGRLDTDLLTTRTTVRWRYRRVRCRGWSRADRPARTPRSGSAGHDRPVPGPGAPDTRPDTDRPSRQVITMAIGTGTTTPPARLSAPPQLLANAFTALRIFTGLVFLTNGLAKVFDVGNYDLGFFSFNLVTLGSAQFIATDAAAKTQIAPLGALYRDVVLPNWGLFGPFLTVAELAVGLGLIFGVAGRLAAVGGLALIGPIWVMLWHADLYLWEYPAEDLFPLLLLAIVPTGRNAGFDGRLAARFGGRWPF